MLRLLLIVLALGCNAAQANAQAEQTLGCSLQQEFAPTLQSSPNSVVTFKCDHATSLQLIQAAGRQTRVPIGIVAGRDPTLLSKTIKNFNLERVSARSALLEAIAGTGYSLSESNHVFVLVASDLTPRQRQVLDHVYPDFEAGPDQTMVGLGAQLTMWMLTEIDHVPGFAASIGGSLNDERFTFAATPPSTTEEIADRIVSLGSKGMWVLSTDAFQRDSGWTDELKAEPYQHYSDNPNVERAK